MTGDYAMKHPSAFSRQRGVMLLEDLDEGIFLTVLDRACNEVRTERLSTERSAKLRVGGTAP